MSRPTGVDAPGLLLAAAARLLPARRREWRRAMRAELAHIESPADRWRFAVSCLRMAATRPASLRAAGLVVLAVGALAAVLGWTRGVAYPPLRWGLVTLVSVLLAVAWLGRYDGPLGPVGGGVLARCVRSGGCLVLGMFTVGVVGFLGASGDPGERAGVGVPIFTVVLSGYLFGLLAVTGARSAATGRVLAAGAGAGVGAAAFWALTVGASGSIPANVTLALPLTAGAMALAARVEATGRPGAPGPHAGADRGGRTGVGIPERRLLAALCAGLTAALLIVVLVTVMSTYGSASLIPDLAPAALTPADDLAQSRVEVQDPYVALLFLGCLVAVLLGVVSIATGARRAPRAR